MCRCWFLALLYLIAAIIPGCSKSPIDRAQAFLDAGMPTQATPLLQMEIQSNPKNARAHLMLGQAQLFLNDPEAAKESFDRALLLKPSWADQVGRAYLAAANRLISGDQSEISLAASYLATVMNKTHSFDKDVARLLRRAGFRLGSAELLRSAVQADADLARDDSVAAYIAIDPGQVQDAKMQAMKQFLELYPKSTLRPNVLVEIARLEILAGDRPKAKSYAEEASRLATDSQVTSAARSLLEQIAYVERTELEAGEAARQAELRAQEARVRQKLSEQEARARAEQAQAERKERLAREEQERQEEQALASQVLLGRWYFDKPPCNDPKNSAANTGSYIEFETIAPAGALAGAFVRPAENNRRTPFQGTLRGRSFELIMTDGGVARSWRGAIDLEAKTLSGSAGDVQGPWVLRGGWTAQKR
jgi:hypothetical protein